MPNRQECPRKIEAKPGAEFLELLDRPSKCDFNILSPSCYFVDNNQVE
ncbi:Protein of unknown function [Bacillus cytotoxicus]|nr:Protein of unknown function [Bacillus cytotoxicus]